MQCFNEHKARAAANSSGWVPLAARDLIELRLCVCARARMTATHPLNHPPTQKPPNTYLLNVIKMLLQAGASRRDACQRDVCAMVHARFGGVHAMVLCVRDGMCVRCCGGVRATVVRMVRICSCA